MDITTIGIDLAKNVFQIHGIDHGQAVVRNKLACGSALLGNNGGRDGMVPQFVKPNVKTNEIDDADADDFRIGNSR